MHRQRIAMYPPLIRLEITRLTPEQTENTLTHTSVITDFPMVFDCHAIWHSPSVWLNAWPGPGLCHCHYANSTHTHNMPLGSDSKIPPTLLLWYLITACTHTSSSLLFGKVKFSTCTTVGVLCHKDTIPNYMNIGSQTGGLNFDDQASNISYITPNLSHYNSLPATHKLDST